MPVMIMTIPGIDIQRGMILEHLDGIDAKMKEHYIAIDEGENDEEHFPEIVSLLEAKWTLCKMLRKLETPPSGVEIGTVEPAKVDMTVLEEFD
jgi:hypothetical protein